MKFTRNLFALILVSLTLTFCSDNDDSSDENSDDCPELVSQEAQGNFRGTDFVNQGGFYKEQTFGGNTTYRCEIYVKEATGGDCFFPEFEAPRDIILFSIESLEQQTIEVSDLSGANTLNFNRIADGTTTIELAECGTITITNFDSATSTLEGTVVALGQFGSVINGAFSLELCDL
ncbi:hypothetical protein MG296_08895 [Flavobacteriaceae bacterium TK19130]|nr:hypothetical protein [Thermobacterium salinum]